MKKNLYLLGILTALIIGTYFFQEVRTNRIFEESLTKDHLISADEIHKLEFGDVEAVKKDGQWWSGDQLLSHNTFLQIVKKISQIKKIKSIEGEQKNYFSDPLTFEVNDKKWQLGDLTLDRQGFYVSHMDKTMVAVMEGEGQEVTDDSANIVEKKLMDLKSALSVKKVDLQETQLFRFYPQLPLGTVRIESDGRPSYALDLRKNLTVPPPIKGIEVQDNILEKFNSLVTQVTIKKEVPYNEKLKFMKIGEMHFEHDNKQVKWELWLKSDNSADSFIIDSQMKKAWLMVGGTLRIFFLGIQAYWDKKVIPPSSFKEFNRMAVTFSQGDKSVQVEVINREPLDFEAPNFKVDGERMNILFQYLFNLSEKDQADRVSQLSSSERKEVLSGNFLRVEVMGQDILFWRKKEELILVNLTQGFKAHFLLRDESFRASFEDVLK